MRLRSMEHTRTHMGDYRYTGLREVNQQVKEASKVTIGVTNVKRMKSILLSKEKLCLYIHESLELHGSLWKLTIANTSGGGE